MNGQTAEQDRIIIAGRTVHPPSPGRRYGSEHGGKDRKGLIVRPDKLLKNKNLIIPSS